MDPAPESSRPENIVPEEVMIPKETAMALGRGLNQLLKDPAEQIRKRLENLKKNRQINQTYLKQIEKSFSSLTAISKNLEQSKEARITPVGRLWALKFSEDKEAKDLPIQAEIIIDETTTPKLSQLRIAMADKFNNSLQSMLGFSEKLQSWDIHSASQSIFRKLNPIHTADYQLRILTSPDGTTTIVPTPNPHGQPSDMTPG